MRFCTGCVNCYVHGCDALKPSKGDRKRLRCSAFKHPVDGSDEFCHDVRERWTAHWGRYAAAALPIEAKTDREASIVEALLPNMVEALCPDFKERDETSVGTECPGCVKLRYALSPFAKAGRVFKEREIGSGIYEPLSYLLTEADRANWPALDLQPVHCLAAHHAMEATNETSVDATETEGEGHLTFRRNTHNPDRPPRQDITLKEHEVWTCDAAMLGHMGRSDRGLTFSDLVHEYAQHVATNPDDGPLPSVPALLRALADLLDAGLYVSIAPGEEGINAPPVDATGTEAQEGSG